VAGTDCAYPGIDIHADSTWVVHYCRMVDVDEGDTRLDSNWAVEIAHTSVSAVFRDQ